MSDPDWAIVLSALHVSQLAADIERGDGFTLAELVNPLKEETGLGERAVQDALDYLREVRLVHSFDDTEGERIGALTPKGFDVAHERDLNGRQVATNKVLSALTAGLFFAAAIQAIAAYYTVPPQYQIVTAGWTVFAGIAIAITIAAIFKR